MIPRADPIVVYMMVTVLIVAIAIGVFFASPLREFVTGPDDTTPPNEDEPAGPLSRPHSDETGKQPPDDPL